MRGTGVGLGLGWQKVANLAFWSSVLTQEGGNGAGFSDLFRKRALHVFDGRVSAGVQQELHDLYKLAR